MRSLVISALGFKDSGKTTLIEYLISHLSDKGFGVAIIMYFKHEDFTVDISGKDTWRHLFFGRISTDFSILVIPN
ncbi:MAG: hypothetical protein GTN80_06585 [Nitrososphaeria archaeon]|nr:hypothetical protein [Nitrososphaeria archaeon]NIQ33294.1 hypothetical protein [Nitrososphaeria archaeon]